MATITIGQMADSYYEARRSRLAQSKLLDEMKSNEEVAKRMLMDALRAQGLDGAKGHVCNAAITRSTEIMMEKDDDGNNVGREKLEQFILDTGDLALLQFRPSITRAKELWAEGVAIPGISPITVEDISLTKVKK